VPVALRTPRLLLVRHGETEWNLARRYQGWSDSPLTERGLAQAEAIGRYLCTHPDAAGAAIVASPIGRARRTAEIIRESLDRSEPLRFDDRLRELSFGAWDGFTRAEIAALRPAAFDNERRHEWYFATPDGETYQVFAGRVGAWLAEATAEDRPLIVVTHGVVTRILRGLYTGLSPAEAMRLPVPQDRIYRLAGGMVEEIGVSPC
jgi:broad specificity phosphatase PhoE